MQARWCGGANRLRTSPSAKPGNLINFGGGGISQNVMTCQILVCARSHGAPLIRRHTGAASRTCTIQCQPNSSPKPCHHFNKGEARRPLVTEPPALGIANGLFILIAIIDAHSDFRFRRPTFAAAPVWRPGDACRGERRQLRKKNQERGLDKNKQAGQRHRVICLLISFSAFSLFSIFQSCFGHRWDGKVGEVRPRQSTTTGPKSKKAETNNRQRRNGSTGQ